MKFLMSLFLVFLPALSSAAPGKGEAENKACFTVNGMTCASCSLTVKSAVRQLEGIKDIVVSVDKSEAVVSFDKKKTTIKDISAKINAIGGDYKASVKQCKA